MQLAIFQMYRKPEEISNSMSKAYKTSPAQFFPVSTKYQNPLFKSQIPQNPKSISIPFNQVSAINLGQRLTPKSGLVNEKAQTNSSVKIFPNTKKVYFTFIRPQDLQVQRRYIQTIVHQREIPFTNEWEQRYYELQKNMNLFVQNHQKMSEQFVKIKDQMRSSTRYNREASELGLLKAKQMLEERYQQQVADLKMQIDRLREEGKAKELEIRCMFQKNLRQQNLFQKSENNLKIERAERNKVEKERNDLRLQIQIQEEDQKIWERQKSGLQNEIYDIKMVLAGKNIQIQKLQKNYEQKVKSLECWAKQNLEENMNKKKEEYDRKQKKFEKTIVALQQEMEKLKTQLLSSRENAERKAEQCKKTEKQLQQLLERFENLSQSYQSLMQVKGNDPISSYETKILELNKMLGQKNEKINQAKLQISKLNEMIDQYADNYISQKQLNTLKSDIQEKKNRILEQGGVNYDQLNNKATFYFNDKIFEQKMIYQLKKDNQKMLTILQKVNMANIVNNHLHVTNSTVTISDQSAGDLTSLMKTLISDIFAKTQRISSNIKIDQPNSQVLIRSMKSIKDENIKNSRRSEKKKNRKVDSDKENPTLYSILDQIQILKIYLVDLSSTWNKLFEKLEAEKKETKKLSKKQSDAIEKERMLQSMCPKNQQLIQYYKTKNEELQKRVEQLLSFGDLLKNRLVAKSSIEDCTSSSDYWKNEAESTQEKCSQIESRYDKLLEQYDKCIQRMEIYQSKIALLSLEVDRLNKQKVEQQRKIQSLLSLSSQNESLMGQRSKLERQLSISTCQVEKIAMKLEESFKIIANKEKEAFELHLKLQEILKQKQNLEIRFNEKSKQQNYVQTQLREEKKRAERFEQDIKILEEECGRKTQMMMEAKRVSAELEKQIIQDSKKRYPKRVGFQIEQNKPIQAREEKLMLEKRKLEQVILQLRSQLPQSRQLSLSGENINPLGKNNNFYYLLEKMRSLIQHTENIVEQINQGIIKTEIRQKLKENFNQMLNLVSGLSQSTTEQASQAQGNTKCRNDGYVLEYLRSLLLELEIFINEMHPLTQKNQQIKQSLCQQINKGLVKISLLSDFYI